MKDKKPAAHSSLCETQHEKGTLRFSEKEKKTALYTVNFLFFQEKEQLF